MQHTIRVFVSHSHQDNDYCREFVAVLRRDLGSEDAVWYDEHNLGWGALRESIEREMQEREHFIAILSPGAITSNWVNIEIDAALALLSSGNMRTFQFVTAAPYKVPVTLVRYKRIERPDGKGFPSREAAARAIAVIRNKAAIPPDVDTAQVPPPPEASRDSVTSDKIASSTSVSDDVVPVGRALWVPPLINACLTGAAFIAAADYNNVHGISTSLANFAGGTLFIAIAAW